MFGYKIDVYSIMDKKDYVPLFLKTTDHALEILNKSVSLGNCLEYFSHLQKPETIDFYLDHGAHNLYTITNLCLLHKIRCLFQTLRLEEKMAWFHFLRANFLSLSSFSFFEEKLMVDLEFLLKTPFLETFEQFSDLYMQFTCESLVYDPNSLDIDIYFHADDCQFRLYHILTCFQTRVHEAGLCELLQKYIFRNERFVPLHFTDFILCGLVCDTVFEKLLNADDKDLQYLSAIAETIHPENIFYFQKIKLLLKYRYFLLENVESETKVGGKKRAYHFLIHQFFKNRNEYLSIEKLCHHSGPFSRRDLLLICNFLLHTLKSLSQQA